MDLRSAVSDRARSDDRVPGPHPAGRSPTLAAVVLVLVALTVSTPAAIAMAIIQLIYQQLENYVVYPLVYRRAVELSAFTTIVAVLIASSILGVLGAILAVPFAAIIKIVLREASRPRRERMVGLRASS